MHDNEYGNVVEKLVSGGDSRHIEEEIETPEKKSGHINDGTDQEKSERFQEDLEEAGREEGVKYDKSLFHRSWRRLRCSKLVVCIFCWLLVTT